MFVLIIHALRLAPRGQEEEKDVVKNANGGGDRVIRAL